MARGTDSKRRMINATKIASRASYGATPGSTNMLDTVLPLNRHVIEARESSVNNRVSPFIDIAKTENTTTASGPIKLSDLIARPREEESIVARGKLWRGDR